MPKIPIVFILGLSGAGKSTLGGSVEKALNFLHIEQDIPNGSGIDNWGLRRQWQKFLKQNDASELVSSLRKIVAQQQKKGVVITFDSFVSFSKSNIKCAEESGISLVLLDGSNEDCLASFISREKALNTGRGNKRWNDFNHSSSKKFNLPMYDPLRVKAFTGHKHRPKQVLVEEIARRVTLTSE
jgi:shikimate kinase